MNQEIPLARSLSVLNLYFFLGVLGCLAVTTGCGETAGNVTLRSLSASDGIAPLCVAVATEEDEDLFEPRPLDSCPDLETNDGELRRMFALVSQVETGEVALVRVDSGEVVDSEPTLPGVNFLPVGAEPGEVVATPGGVASFVAVRESGREGLYALPTSCVAQRAEGELFRDMTSWPACRLPAAPGAMRIVIDPGVDDDGDPQTPRLLKASCDSNPEAAAALINAAPAAQRDLCPADLAAEGGPRGRRKLLVALPSRGEVLVLDAQQLLDREPGSFDACPIERRVSLTAQVEQAEPGPLPDLDAEAGCEIQAPPRTISSNLEPRPSDFALADQTLYVADSGVPAVHRLDVSDPCDIRELPPLLPKAFLDPDLVVTTRRVAVSPLTSANERFVYAIDDSDSEFSGSVMVFDVSDATKPRTPVVRPKSRFIPQEPPDRIQFVGQASDVEFVQQRFPIVDPVTGVAVDGVLCDPSSGADAVAALYRPGPDLAGRIGASPTRLRGMFAMIALHSGQVAVIDVEDLDAPCRRPSQALPGAQHDYRGCSDSSGVTGYGENVSGELSCNVIEPHRARSATFFVNDVNLVRSAALRQFPRLSSERGRSLTVDRTEDGKQNPRMLAVDFTEEEAGQDSHARVFVGTSLFENQQDAVEVLDIDPATAESNSLSLSYEEPRAYFPGEEFVLTYEGTVRGEAQSFFEIDDGVGVFDDGANGEFCSSGVQDEAATRVFGERFVGATSHEFSLDAFVQRHTDYVHITSDFPDEDDTYWDEEGASCGSDVQVGSSATIEGRLACENLFGRPTTPKDLRDLRIVEAYASRIAVVPRDYDSRRDSPRIRDLVLELVDCCFPRATSYEVRAGHQWLLRGSQTGFVHDMRTEPGSLRCVQDCNPLVQGRSGRVLEISCSDAEGCPQDDDGDPIIGLADPPIDLSSLSQEEQRRRQTAFNMQQARACVVDDPSEDIRPDSACVFRSLTSRFAIYRGLRPSVRDMRYTWQHSGGFAPLSVSLSNLVNTAPQRLEFIPGLSRIAVADGAASGVILIDFRDRSIGVVTIN